MNDRLLAYIISLGIAGTGVIWIVAGKGAATPAVSIAIGVVTVAVGLISLLVELRNGT